MKRRRSNSRSSRKRARLELPRFRTEIEEMTDQQLTNYARRLLKYFRKKIRKVKFKFVRRLKEGVADTSPPDKGGFILIRIARRVHVQEGVEYLQDSLLHELTHAYTFRHHPNETAEHGRHFRRCIRRLQRVTGIQLQNTWEDETDDDLDPHTSDSETEPEDDDEEDSEEEEGEDDGDEGEEDDEDGEGDVAMSEPEPESFSEPEPESDPESDSESPEDSRDKGGSRGQEEAMTRLLISDNSADPRFDLRHEEVLASNLMKQLTHKYGTRGKSAKFIFMQAFQESQRPDAKGVLGKLSRPRAELCDTEESRTHGFMDDFELELGDSDAVGTTRHESDDNKSKLLARPAAMVTQSHFVSRLEDQVKMEVQRNGCPAPQFEMSWLYEQIRRENPKTGTGIGVAEVPVDRYSIRNDQDEPEEKLVARLKNYRRAFSALILHFQALRPLLGDIKQQYDAMLSYKDQQVAEAAKVNQNLHHLELNFEQKMASTKFEGFRQVAALEKQCLLLMRHVDRQDLAMRTITDILNKLETSLSEEHDLRRDSEDADGADVAGGGQSLTSAAGQSQRPSAVEANQADGGGM